MIHCLSPRTHGSTLQVTGSHSAYSYHCVAGLFKVIQSVVSDPTCDTFQDLDDEMAEDDGDEEDDFWLGKLKDFISPCQPIFRKGIKVLIYAKAFLIFSKFY